MWRDCKNSQASRQLADDFSELEKSCKKIEPKDLPKTRLLIKILRFLHQFYNTKTFKMFFTFEERFLFEKEELGE